MFDYERYYEYYEEKNGRMSGYINYTLDELETAFYFENPVVYDKLRAEVNKVAKVINTSKETNFIGCKFGGEYDSTAALDITYDQAFGIIVNFINYVSMQGYKIVCDTVYVYLDAVELSEDEALKIFKDIKAEVLNG